MARKKIYKPVPISGFPEWTPEIRAVELRWLDHIRRTFELYGFCSIETPAAEEINVLLAKGETDKEIYTLTRLQAEAGDKAEARLGLHFDQTVPFARYTAQHFNNLVFPFKRYQIQKVWRGERPQLGRSREFYQCDIDVINVDQLPLHFDAEMPAVISHALEGLNIGDFQIRISNRKILLGLLQQMNIEDKTSVTRIIDKYEKIGGENVCQLLEKDTKMNAPDIDRMIKLVKSRSPSDVTALNEEMEEGLKELEYVCSSLSCLPEGRVVPDLSIVRGLDYYTGTVYETRLLEIPEFTSSVCSGGRYDDLAGGFINRNLPGVGISIGFTRLFEVLLHHGYIRSTSFSPAKVLVALWNENEREKTLGAAHALRARGINTETYHAPHKIGRQISYAEKKGINYIWFPPCSECPRHEVKNLSERTQLPADPDIWTPSSDEKAFC